MACCVLIAALFGAVIRRLRPDRDRPTPVAVGQWRSSRSDTHSPTTTEVPRRG